MDETAILEDPAPEPRPRGWRTTAWRAMRVAGTAMFGLVFLIAALIAFLHTSPGRQFIVGQIAKYAPASGLKIRVGRIEGSVLWSATFHDVEFRDARGRLFLTAPEIDLNWRPYRFPFGKLDVRHLVMHDGTLFAVPELDRADPDAPFLPDFDIRLDRFLIDDLRVAEGVLGEPRMVDFTAEADIRNGLVFVDADGELGGADAFSLLVHAEPDGDRFDLDLDYRAPAGGLLATLAKAEEDLRLRIEGDGSWSSWEGALRATQGGRRIAELNLYNTGGTYRAAGSADPTGYLSGLPARALGRNVMLAATGTLEDRTVEGNFSIRGRGVDLDAEGAIDLAGNRYRGLKLEAALLDETLFGEGVSLAGARLEATLDGPFRDISARHRLTVDEIEAGGLLFAGVTQEGVLRHDGTRTVVPLGVRLERATIGNEVLDPRLVDGHIGGTLTLAGSQLQSDDLAIRFAGLSGDLVLRADLDRGGYGLAGPVRAQNLAIEGLGALDGRADIRLRLGRDVPWQLQARIDGRMARVSNETLAGVTGGNVRFAGDVSLGGGQPILFRGAKVEANKLSLALNGEVTDEGTMLAGSGRHADYGPFTLEAQVLGDGPHAALVFADPYPAAGLKDVHVTLAPDGDGFTIGTRGASLLGAFEGALGLAVPQGGPARLSVRRLDVQGSRITGALTIGKGGLAGGLEIAGAGLDGTINLAPHDGGQAFHVTLAARNARFAGEQPLAIAQGRIEAQGLVAEGRSSIAGDMLATGVRFGAFNLTRVAARANIENGAGRFDAAITGRDRNRFNLQLAGTAAPERMSLALRGAYAGRDIVMPRRAVLLKTGDGGWALQQTQFGFGEGFVVAEGRFGGERPLQLRLGLAEVSLAVVDLMSSDIGLGGSVSGTVDLSAGPGYLPVGEARLKVDDLTRSGLLLSSRPIDLALVARLTPEELRARAVFDQGSDTKGRLQARIGALPAQGSLMDRLYEGSLRAQLRYDGPADSLWRLATIELFDVTGDVGLAADISGSLGNPRARGTLTGDDLQIRSAVTGTAISEVEARGRFDGSRLLITRLAGAAANGGRISGSGYLDFAGMNNVRGPKIDLRIAARNAEVLDLRNMGATVTGPMRFVSDGVGGTIAGRLTVTRGRWQLGAEAVAQPLPEIATREVNLPPDRMQLRAQGAPWRYLIDASSRGGVEVDGMGLDSEWRGDISLRGTTADPRIGGEVRSIPRQSFYSFAGMRFEITRGVISFDEDVAIDPRLNLLAETDIDSLSVSVSITGSSSAPEIAFSSVPSLPEEEVLARLLFGDSVTDLSATDALQLGSALASLRGGGGIDPINRLRQAIGLDRLRILSADPAYDRGAAIALGKNVTRRVYVELVTDGAGYNASQVEFRVTGWLSLLGSIDTVGRQSATVEVSRDY